MKKHFKFMKDREERARDLAALYPEKRSALLPVLWLVQEQEGWVPPEAASVVGEAIGISAAEVEEAVSFYAMFGRAPIGRHHIQVCTGPCCSLRGAGWLVGYLEEKLGVEAGDTTHDGKFHLSTVECLASCGTAPMMRIDDDYFENLDSGKVDGILSRFV